MDRPDVAAKRTAFFRWMKRVDPRRLVFIDESGANLAMGRSHAWVLPGEEYVEPRPMNWGDNLSLIGAVRLGGWVALGTQWEAVKAKDFTAWVRDRLAPRSLRSVLHPCRVRHIKWREGINLERPSVKMRSF